MSDVIVMQRKNMENAWNNNNSTQNILGAQAIANHHSPDPGIWKNHKNFLREARRARDTQIETQQKSQSWEQLPRLSVSSYRLLCYKRIIKH